MAALQYDGTDVRFTVSTKKRSAKEVVEYRVRIMPARHVMGTKLVLLILSF